MRRALLMQALVVAGACAGGAADTTKPPDATKPKSNQPLAFVAGAGASDTIDSANRVQLTIRARDNSGAPLSELVLFRVTMATSSSTGRTLTGSLTNIFLTTDAQGLGSTELQLGEVAGTWYVVARDDRGATDSVAFTVRPGAPARVKLLTSRDTALFVGGRYTFAGTPLDRYDNPVATTLTYSADSVTGAASVTSAGVVSAAAVGRSRFLIAAGGRVLDTARVSVVPPGRLAAESDEGLVVLNMDGSSYRVLVPGSFQLMFPSWSPDGTGIVYDSPTAVTGLLYRVDLASGAVTKLSAASAMPSESWARYSADGQYIYFSGGYYPDSIDTYRMRADGTGPRVRVTPLRPGSTRYWKGSPSPDGTLLAYSEAGFVLHVVNLVDGTDRIVTGPAEAESPRFSPAGDWIAYANEYAHSIELIRADGTGQRVVTPSWVWAGKWGHDWSPDGAWIVISGGAIGYSGLSIVRVSDGLVLPLPFRHYLSNPSWHQ